MYLNVYVYTFSFSLSPLSHFPFISAPLTCYRGHDSDKTRRTIAGVMLFETNMTLNHGILHTGLRYGIQITTQSRSVPSYQLQTRVIKRIVRGVHINFIYNNTASHWDESLFELLLAYIYYKLLALGIIAIFLFHFLSCSYWSICFLSSLNEV